MGVNYCGKRKDVFLFLLQLLGRDYTVELVAWADSVRYLKRYVNTFLHYIYRFKIYTCLFQIYIHRTSSRTGNQQFVANLDFCSLYKELGHTYI